jgi:hypothetical protein
MKLTAGQIATIEQTLVLNGVVYDDIKLEILDHIASEIEEDPNSDVKTFEIILKEVLEKWKPQLKPATYGLWLGRGYSGPKIIMDKMAAYTKSRLAYILFGSVPLTLFTITLLHLFNSETVIDIFTKSIRGLYLLEVFFAALGWGLILKSKKKTTFSYLFKKRSVLIFFQPLLIGIGVFPLGLLQNSLDIQMGFTYFLFALALYFMLDFKLVYNHFKTIKRLSISNL